MATRWMKRIVRILVPITRVYARTISELRDRVCVAHAKAVGRQIINFNLFVAGAGGA